MITTPQQQQQQSMLEEATTDMLTLKHQQRTLQPLHKNKSRIESISSITTESTSSCSTIEDEDHSIELDSDDSSNTSNLQEDTTESSSMDAITSNLPALQLQATSTHAVTPHTALEQDNAVTTSNSNYDGTDDEFEDEITTEDHPEQQRPSPPLQTQPTSLPEFCSLLPRDSSVTDRPSTNHATPRRSCIKDTSHESIPLRNHGWKNLPKLTHANIQSKFVVSELTERSTKSSALVQFSSIEVRSYDLCIGDNPSVSWGTPISLDWDYVVELKDTVDNYESIRSLTKRRNMRQMMMNFNYRRNILLLHWNVTEEQLLQAEKEMNLIRSQRNVTRALLPLAPIEDCMTSLYRKIQRRRTRSTAVSKQQPVPSTQQQNIVPHTPAATTSRKLQHARNSIITMTTTTVSV